MNDLEKQFFAQSDDLETQFFAEAPKDTTKRGANLAGAIRNVAQATPFIGTYADELEAAVRAGEKGLDYETWRRNAEESALGNIANTGYGRGLEIGTSLAENALLAGLTGGATLMPTISAIQGAVEGFGRGSDVGERTAQAIVGGGLGFAIPTALNRVLPTKTVQNQIIKEATKSKDAIKSIIAKALQKETTPEDVIAREVPRGMRPDLWAGIRRAATAENAFRKNVLKQASETYSKPYEEYIVEEIGNVVPKYAQKLGAEIENMKLDQLGEDIVGEIDPRKYVMDAVNKVMKSASQEEKDLAVDAMEQAIAKRGVAKKLTSAAMERPINPSSGSVWNWLRRINAPIKNLSNEGLIRAMTVGTPNYEARNALERMLNFYTPNWLRGGLDTFLENYERETIK